MNISISTVTINRRPICMSIKILYSALTNYPVVNNIIYKHIKIIITV